MKPTTGTATVALLLALAACSGGHSGGGTGATADDETFLKLATQNSQLAREDHGTLISLGHEACDLLGDYSGDTTQVDKFFVTSAGKGGPDFFTPSVLVTLRSAAATAYCPRYAT